MWSLYFFYTKVNVVFEVEHWMMSLINSDILKKVYGCLRGFFGNLTNKMRLAMALWYDRVFSGGSRILYLGGQNTDIQKKLTYK